MVFPGTRLAVTEEFIGGHGTYTEGNYIFAAVAGKVSINIERHEISVMSKPTTAVIPKEGDIVIGGVVNASRQMITVSVHYVNNQEVYPTYTMVIHVSQLSREYLETVDEAVCLADIVRAKVIDDKTISNKSIVGYAAAIHSCYVMGEYAVVSIDFAGAPPRSLNNIFANQTTVYGRKYCSSTTIRYISLHFTVPNIATKNASTNIRRITMDETV